jgi:hypothetical protein
MRLDRPTGPQPPFRASIDLYFGRLALSEEELRPARERDMAGFIFAIGLAITVYRLPV